MSRKSDQEAAMVRATVAATTHDEAYLVHLALEAYAAVLTVVDRSFPDPEQRERAAAAAKLAERFANANMARHFLEEKATA